MSRNWARDGPSAQTKAHVCAWCDRVGVSVPMIVKCVMLWARVVCVSLYSRRRVVLRRCTLYHASSCQRGGGASSEAAVWRVATLLQSLAARAAPLEDRRSHRRPPRLSLRLGCGLCGTQPVKPVQSWELGPLREGAVRVCCPAGRNEQNPLIRVSEHRSDLHLDHK